MADTVWMKLHTNKKAKHFMFGPSGIVRFEPNETGTAIVGADCQVYMVDESPKYIMNVLSAVRRTQGVTDGIDQCEEKEEEVEGRDLASETLQTSEA